MAAVLQLETVQNGVSVQIQYAAGLSKQAQAGFFRDQFLLVSNNSFTAVYEVSDAGYDIL